MTVKDHYDRYLGNFYSWTVGSFTEKQEQQERLFLENDVTPRLSRIAFDLGSGHGIHSIALANLGFSVHAVDFNHQLLKELKERIASVIVRLKQLMHIFLNIYMLFG